MNLQSNPGNRLIINERNSGILVQRDSREDEEFFLSTFLITAISSFFLQLVVGAERPRRQWPEVACALLLSSAPVRRSASTIAWKSERIARPKFSHATHTIIRLVRVDTCVTG